MPKMKTCPKCKDGFMIKTKGIIFCGFCGFEAQKKGRPRKVTVREGRNTYNALTGDKIPTGIEAAWEKVKRGGK